MPITVIGLNHKTAPVGIREKLAFNPVHTARALELLKTRYSHAEFVLLSTCNRVELYIAAKENAPQINDLIEFFADFHKAPHYSFKDFLYVHRNDAAAGHLMKVAASLDSMLPGDSQVFGQVKQSYKLACEAKCTGKILNRMFHNTFSTAKKIFTETSITTGRVSVAGLAAGLAVQQFSDPAAVKIVVLGAGKMGELLIRHLLHEGYNTITVVNRTEETGQKTAAQYGITFKPYHDLDSLLFDADIVIGSAAAPNYLFDKTAFEKLLGDRPRKCLMIVDIAVPRNFDPAIGQLEDVTLYSIDDLADQAQKNLQMRQNDVSRALEIVSENTAVFMDWLKINKDRVNGQDPEPIQCPGSLDLDGAVVVKPAGCLRPHCAGKKAVQ